MHPDILHGVGVITKLYFAICGIYGISDLEYRSKVIRGHRFWYQPKARIHILLVVNSNWTLSCTVSEIRRLKCRKSTFSPTPLLFRLKFGCLLRLIISPYIHDVGFSKSQVPKVKSVKLFSKNSNACDQSPPTDRRTT